jgi:hypothetical protein
VASKESVVIKSYELAKYSTKFSVPQKYPSWHEKKAKAWQRCHCFCISKVHTSFRTHQKDSSNAESNLRIENLTVLRLDKRKINRKELDVVVFVSDTYRTSVTEVPELYAVGRYISGKSEGPRDFFFDQETAAGAEGQNPNPMPDEVNRISRRSITDEDIFELRGVAEVDDDNEIVLKTFLPLSLIPTVIHLVTEMHFGKSPN